MRNKRFMATLSMFAVTALVLFSFGCKAEEEPIVDNTATTDTTTQDQYGTTDTSMTTGTGDMAGDPNMMPSDPNRSMGTMIDDQTIQTQVKAKMMADGRVEANDINLQVLNGVVTMMGAVKSDAEKTAAEEVARTVEGVTSVDNQLTVGKK